MFALHVMQSKSIAVAGLLPGKLFQAVIYPTISSGKESSVPAKIELRSTCGCPIDEATLRQTEVTGKPTNVALTQVCSCVGFRPSCFYAFGLLQRRGKIYLSWKDTSLCESGFVFDRAGSSFTPIYNFESPQVCFTQHSPSSIFDDLTTSPNIKLGSTQTYCVRAANPVGYKFGYRSDPGCQDITIAWESMV
jgi:hypothetical protein